jgi:hypothetical protein
VLASKDLDILEHRSDLFLQHIACQVSVSVQSDLPEDVDRTPGPSEARCEYSPALPPCGLAGRVPRCLLAAVHFGIPPVVGERAQ